MFANAEEFPSHKVTERQAKNLIFADEDTPRQVVYGLEDRIVAEREGLIFENVLPSQLPPGTYTYVILEEGSIVFGKVSTNLEFGAKHFHLANGRPVKVAGEVAIGETGRYVFNLRSGTFTSPILDQKFNQFQNLGTAAARQEVAKFEATLQKNVDAVFDNYFGRKGDFTKYGVLPNQPSSLDELVDICVRSGLDLPACGSDDVKILVDQRRGMVVSDAADACVIAGGAIYGAACTVPVRGFTKADNTVVPLDVTNAEKEFRRADGESTSYRMVGTVPGDNGGKFRVLERDQTLENWVNYNARNGDGFRGDPETNIQIFGEAAAAELGIKKEGSNYILLPDAKEINIRLDRLDALTQDPQLKTSIRFYEPTGRVPREEYLRHWAYEGKLPLAAQGDEALHDVNVHLKGFLLPNEMIEIERNKVRIYLEWGEFIEARNLKNTPVRRTFILSADGDVVEEVVLLGTRYDEGIERLDKDLDLMTGTDFIKEDGTAVFFVSFSGKRSLLEDLERQILMDVSKDHEIAKAFREFSEQAVKNPSFTKRTSLSHDDIRILTERRLENIKNFPDKVSCSVGGVCQVQEIAEVPLPQAAE